MPPPPPTTESPRFDYLLVGGGLQNALIALSLLQRRPQTSLALIEKSDRLGGNHLWSFHAGDVPDEAIAFIAPLVENTFPAYRVHFPTFDRTVASLYAAVGSEHLDRVVSEQLRQAPRASLLLRSEVAEIEPHRVRLTDGRELSARLVIDSRGPERFADGKAPLYQKFLGLELETKDSLETTLPCVMDARVEQKDGMRFVYVQPRTRRRLLVEDTYYAESPILDKVELSTRILAYAKARLGIPDVRVVREESGVLPLPIHPPRAAPEARSPLSAGYQGGFFHPTTGYSFPSAVRLALHIAGCEPENVFGPAWDRLLRTHRRQVSFFCLLNRMLLRSVAPADRFRLLARFYRLPDATIRRFYAMTLTAGDRARIVCGRPPAGLSLSRALKEIWA